MHNPTYSLSTSDHVILYVYRSLFFAINQPQSLNGHEHLFDLIGFGHPLIVLNIDSRITWLRSLKNHVAPSAFSWGAEVIFTEFAKVTESSIIRVIYKSAQDFLYSFHYYDINNDTNVKWGLN